MIEFDDKMEYRDFAMEVNFIKNAFELTISNYSDPNRSSFYFGLTDFAKEGEWKWMSSGKVFNFTDNQYGGIWVDGEPNGHEVENCACLTYVKAVNYDVNLPKLVDINCEEKLTIICQRELYI